MIVDRIFKGTLPKTVTFFDSGMCDGPTFKVGEQYLMYTSGDANQPLPARGCSRSRPVVDAAEDVQFLEQYAAGNTETKIEGVVYLDGSADDQGKVTPVSNVEVTVRTGDATLQANTKDDGRYSFKNVSPGTYTITATLPGYQAVSTSGEEFRVVEHGCHVGDFQMKVDRSVSGKVIDSSGNPIAGANIEMVPVEDKRYAFYSAESDKNGDYTMSGVDAGDYYLGINILFSLPTRENPFEIMYYQNSPDRSGAIAVKVPTEAAALHADLQSVKRLRLVTIRGKVRGPDNKPLKSTENAEIRIKGPLLDGQVDNAAVTIDEQGNFQYQLCEGVTYSIFAFSGPLMSATYSLPIWFTASEDQQPLILTLNATDDEFTSATKGMQSAPQL